MYMCSRSLLPYTVLYTVLYTYTYVHILSLYILTNPSMIRPPTWKANTAPTTPTIPNIMTNIPIHIRSHGTCAYVCEPLVRSTYWLPST